MARKRDKAQKSVEQARSKHSGRASVFLKEFREDLQYWIQADRRIAVRVLELVDDILRDPFVGIGKPEPLKHLGPNIWSRRLTAEHRVVYLVKHDAIDFLMCRFHYA